MMKNDSRKMVRLEKSSMKSVLSSPIVELIYLNLQSLPSKIRL